MTNTLPQATLGLIGGTATLQCRIPEEVGDSDIELLESGLVFEAPFGATAPFKLLRTRAGATT